MNLCVISGRMAADPEIRQTQSGVSVTSFRLAVDRDYAAKGKERETDWIDCVAWRERGEAIAKYFSKGKPVTVIGSIETRTWEDKQGQKRKAVEVVVDRFEFAMTDKTQAQASDQTALPFDF